MTLSVPEILNRLAELPAKVRQVCTALPNHKLGLRPAPGVFAPLEDAWHLHDIERAGWCVRIGRILGEHQPMLDSIDGDRLAIERRYLELDLEAALDGFAAARVASLRLLAEVTESALERTAVFEGRIITLRDLLVMMEEHDAAHFSRLRGAHVTSRAA
jgi:hypothetical protein